MRKHRAALLGALLAAALPAGAATLWVDDGCAPPGSGSQLDPFCTVQEALDAAQPLDIVRVMTGTYRECAITVEPVSLLADDFELFGRRTTTILDGTGVCDDPQDPWPTLDIGGGSSVRGFTIRGGGLGGVAGYGVVAITNNLIEGNAAYLLDGYYGCGGGIYVNSSVAYGGAGEVRIEGNLVRTNDAAADGGGIYVRGITLDFAPQTIRISENTVTDNLAAGVGGGLAVFTMAPTSGRLDVIVTTNTIDGNGVDLFDGYLGYGGGIWASTYGFGTETIRIEDNVVTSNVAVSDAGGIAAWVQNAYEGSHAVEVLNNTATDNLAGGGGGGVFLYLDAFELASSSVSSLTARGNVVTDNTSLGGDGGGGIAALAVSTGTAAAGVVLSASENGIAGNEAASWGGGAQLLAVADGDAEPTSAARVEFRNNLVVGNYAPVGGGVDAYLQAVGDATAHAVLDFNTIESNGTDYGSGGIELESYTAFDDATGTYEGLARFEIGSSILLNNEGYAIGGPAPSGDGNTGNREIGIRYNDLYANGGTYEGTVGTPPQGNGNILTDPLLDDSWVPGLCSPTLDAADPAAPYALEPPPNGGRANMGHLGGTADAATSLPDINGDRIVDGVDVLRVAVSFASVNGGPRYYSPADLDGDGDVDGTDLAFLGGEVFATYCVEGGR